MLRRFILTAAALAMTLGGCNNDGSETPGINPQPEGVATVPVPDHMVGTVREMAVLTTGRGVHVKAYGVVHGLGKYGSPEVPPDLRDSLGDYLYRRGWGSPREGTGSITPEMILADPDTAVVEVSGYIPPGAAPGTLFDVSVKALPVTSTRSLSGGSLMPVRMRMSLAGEVADIGQTKELAEAAGPIVVDPQLDLADPADQVRSREGKILGGGQLTTPMPLRLELVRPDFARISLLQRRLNDRFSAIGGQQTAVARNSSSIELTVPAEYRASYEHFINLVMHMPITSSQAAAVESKAAELAGKLVAMPHARDDLSLSLEALGKLSLDSLRPLYAHNEPSVRFYASRAGLRLGDALAAEPMIQAARMEDSSYQLPAIGELGRARHASRQMDTLRELLSHDEIEVRTAAYEALLSMDDTLRIERVAVGDGPQRFFVDVVDSDKPGVIYATQSLQPRIALIGSGIAVRRPVFFQSSNNLVTVNAVESDDPLTVFRRILGTGRFSENFEVEPRLDRFIQVLGDPPRRDAQRGIRGLGLNYGQVLSVLSAMAEAGDVNAKFVLQVPPALRRAYESTYGTGRPD
jgi:flagellar basal body P-ring protein FlgI